jgi:hypothetical protein
LFAASNACALHKMCLQKLKMTNFAAELAATRNYYRTQTIRLPHF